MGKKNKPAPAPAPAPRVDYKSDYYVYTENKGEIMYLNDWNSANAVWNQFNNNNNNVKHTIIFDSNISNLYNALLVKKTSYNNFEVKFVKFNAKFALNNALLNDDKVVVNLAQGEGLSSFLTKAYFQAFEKKVNPPSE